MNNRINQRQGLLAGITVLDLSDKKAIFCTKILAELGALVIKIEPPEGGHDRKQGPFINTQKATQSLSFIYNNINKYGLTLNLESHTDKKRFLHLLQNADIVLESFSPGYLKDLGLGFDVLARFNPEIILASVSAFGQNGPWRDNKSCNLTASALGGQIFVNGLQNGSPLMPFGEQAHYAASLYTAVAILLAIQQRRQTNIGQWLDISIHEAVTATLEHVMIRYFSENIIPSRNGTRHWDNAFEILPCKDGHIHLTPLLGWDTLLEWMTSEGMAQDLTSKKWKDEEYRKQNINYILEVIANWTRTHTRNELFELGQLMGFPWAPVASSMEILSSPQLKARNFFYTLQVENNFALKIPGLPFKMSTKFINDPKPAPLLGEDNNTFFGLNSPICTQSGSRRAPARQKTDSPQTKKGILEGHRVLDFTRVLAGPYTTRILADFGAEVIKIQSNKFSKGAESNDGAYFNNWNRNKKSITLNMNHPGAKEIILSLTNKCDIIVENFSPRVMANWGLNYSKLKEMNPDLIMLSMSGMGHSGPWQNMVAFGPTVQSLGGLSRLTSFETRTPIGLGFSYADIISGLYGALAILASIEYRKNTGQGQYIDLSEYEAVCTLIGTSLLNTQVNKTSAAPHGNNAHDFIAAPHGCYRCKGQDRWCAIAVFTEPEWHKLLDIMGNPGWAEENKFSSFSNRQIHAKELNHFIEQWTHNLRARHVMNLLQTAGIFAGVVQNAHDLAHDPQLHARSFFVPFKHLVSGNIITDTYPFHFYDNPENAWKRAPLLGEDNLYVYKELLGLTDSEYLELIEKKIIS